MYGMPRVLALTKYHYEHHRDIGEFEKGFV